MTYIYLYLHIYNIYRIYIYIICFNINTNIIGMIDDGVHCHQSRGLEWKHGRLGEALVSQGHDLPMQRHLKLQRHSQLLSGLSGMRWPLFFGPFGKSLGTLWPYYGHTMATMGVMRCSELEATGD